jgi:Family of unknown function (DUF6807)
MPCGKNIRQLPLLLGCLFCIHMQAQQKLQVELISEPDHQRVLVNIGGNRFTEFIYPDSIEKPILFPIYAPDGAAITRGFPISPLPGEPTDHPHHKGLWFTYENVNGLDFWNNSYAIPADKKNMYGWIKTDHIVEVKSGTNARLVYTANWVDQQNQVLLRETTTFIFSGYKNLRIIDRNTELYAEQDISFNDAKDGLLGLRVAYELELPSAQPKNFTDNKGNSTQVEPSSTATGNYITSEGKEGDSAWSTRGAWCMLYGKKQGDIISIAIIDHPANPGFPTYWHARGYGLFAANPLGEKIFSNGKKTMGFALKKGEKSMFRYRIAIGADNKRLSNDQVKKLATDFGNLPAK